tara:strand:- start:98 stop:607 length:510 start_codon:yes stop_codon:yes gene_type:complete
MGFFSWLMNLFRNLFTKDVRMREINRDLDIDRKELNIDRERKVIEKFENENFRILSVNAHIIFDNTNRTPEARSYRESLFKFIQKVQEIRDSPGIRVEFTHLRELNSIWQSILPNLERDFAGNRKISKAIKIVGQKIPLLAKEIRKEGELLREEEELEHEKETLDKKEE